MHLHCASALYRVKNCASREVTSHFVVGNLTVSRAPSLCGWLGHSSPIFRWWGTIFNISILCFFLLLSSNHPDSKRWLSFKQRIFSGTLFFFFGNCSSSSAGPWSRTGSLSGASSWPGSSTGSSVANNSSLLFWASCPVSLSMDGSRFPASRSFTSFNCLLFNEEASAAFLAEFFFAFDLKYLGSLFLCLPFFINLKIQNRKKARLVFVSSPKDNE